MIRYDKDKDIFFNFSDEKYKVLSEEIRKFIKAMCYMAAIESENLDKEKISKNIKEIQDFIKKCQSANNKVNNMFGFKKNFGELEFGTKEYYFFIADIKIKSAVYILRIENFLRNWAKFNTIEEKRKVFISDIKNMKIIDVKDFFEVSKETEYDEKIFSNIIDENESCQEVSSNMFWKLNESGENTEKIALNNQEKDFQKFCGLIFSFLKNIPTEDDNKKDLKKILKKYKKQKRLLEEKISAKISEIKDNDNSDEQKESKEEKEIEKYIEEQSKKINKIISFDNVEDLFSDNSKELLSKNQDEQNKDVEYYLFDNSMNEISFCGMEWNWLWRYERGKEDLFRCVGTDNFNYHGSYNGENRRLYYQNMIRNIVMHMNKGAGNKLASYSKNPFRDIYKYMISEYQDEYKDIDYCFEITLGYDCIEVRLEENHNEGSKFKLINFAMVKNANTNIIKKMGEVFQGDYDFSIQKNHYKCAPTENINFYDFVLGEDDGENECNFCVDIFNTKESYRGDIRKIFGEYTDTFPGVGVPNHQLSVVASSDEEVVMLGNTCDGIKKDFNPKRYDDCNENIEYRVQLNRDDMLSLFYKMHMLCNKGKVHIKPKLIFKDGRHYCNGIPVKFRDDNIFEFVKGLKESFKKIDTEEIANDIKELVNNESYKEIFLSEKINKIIENQDKNIGNEKEIEKIKKTISEFEKKITEEIKDLIINKAETFSSDKLDFILSFLEESEYKTYPNYGNRTYREDADKLVALYRKLFLK